MTDREKRLRQLTDELMEYEEIEDAFLAKSFTDRLVIIDVSEGDTIPVSVQDRLTDHGIHPAGDQFETGEAKTFAGNVGDATRHHFVDTKTRGAHQSYVVE